MSIDSINSVFYQLREERNVRAGSSDISLLRSLRSSNAQWSINISSLRDCLRAGHQHSLIKSTNEVSMKQSKRNSINRRAFVKLLPAAGAAGLTVANLPLKA